MAKVGKSDVAQAILEQLKNPFDPKLVKFRPTGGRNAAYIDARDVMKRLDDVMGPENWQDNYKDVNDGFVCELTLRIDGEWITKSNGANRTKVEPTKGGISNSLKRAAVNWGVGRYLYYLPAYCNGSNVDKWPKWALPNSGIENWEDVAEMEAELDTGMDDDLYEGAMSAGATALEQVLSAKTREELDTIVSNLDKNTQHVLALQIENKTQELLK